MPRQSERAQTLKVYEEQVREQKEAALLRFVMDDDDDDDSTGSSLLENMIALQSELELERCNAERYLLPRPLYRSGTYDTVFERDLMVDDNRDGTPPWLTSEEFLQKYRDK